MHNEKMTVRKCLIEIVLIFPYNFLLHHLIGKSNISLNETQIKDLKKNGRTAAKI